MVGPYRGRSRPRLGPEHSHCGKDGCLRGVRKAMRAGSLQYGSNWETENQLKIHQTWKIT